MKVYARIDGGFVVEIIPPAPPYDTEAPDWQEGDESRIGTERPIEVRYPAELVATMVDITDMDPQPVQGWTADLVDGKWLLQPYVAPPPTAAQVLASQSAKLQQLNQLAAAQKAALSNRIGVINDAIEFEEATPEEISELPIRQAQLTAWKRYAVLLGRVTTQEGWPPDVIWPDQPSEGMDLSISAARPTQASV